MTIPSGIRRPLKAFTFKTVLARQGLVPLDSNLLLIGMPTSAATKASGAIWGPITSESEASEFFGEGSDLALQCSWAMKGSRDAEQGAGPNIYAIPVDAPGAGTAAIYKYTVGSGTATESGPIEGRIAGRTWQAAIDLGDDQDDAATKIVAAIQEIQRELPITAAINGSNANEADSTCRHKGVFGNDIKHEVTKQVAGLTCTASAPTAGAGVYDLTASLDLAIDQDYDLINSSNHTSTDVSDFAAHLSDRWASTVAQFRFSMMFSAGAVATATALAAAADSERQLVGSAYNFRNTPAEIGAYLSGFLLSHENPSEVFQNKELPSLYLPDRGDFPTDSEIETAMSNGAFILAANKKGTRAKIVAMVCTKTTEGSVPFYDLADWQVMRTGVFTARQIEAVIDRDFPAPKQNARTLKAIRSSALEVLATLEEQPLEALRNVAPLAPELKVTEVSANQYKVDIPLQPTKPARQGDFNISVIV